MKNLLFLCFFLPFVTAQSQEQITLKIVRPSSAQGSEEKIQVSIQNNDYIIKNGGTISVNVVPDYTTSLKIDCSVSSGAQTSYFLDPKRNETYVFEVGLKINGIYIKLTSGQEAKKEELAPPVDTSKRSDEWNTKLKVDRDNLGVSFKAEQTNETQAIRDEWIKRGGPVVYYSGLVQGLYLRMDMGKGTGGAVNGFGGGPSGSVNFINLKIPEYTTGLSTWNSVNAGIGIDANMYGFIYSYKFATTVPTSTFPYYKSSNITMNMTMLTFSCMFIGNLGWTVGLGKFIDEGNWKGVALTLKYRPSFNISSTITTMTSNSTSMPSTSDSSFDTQFNAGGVGFDIDFSNFSSTMTKLAPEAQTKLTFFFLPPIGKSPLFISFGIGVVLYDK